MQINQVQGAVLELLERADRAQRAWIADLSDAERNTTGTPEQWSAKDLVAHITFWEQVTTDRLAAAARGEQPSTFGDFQPVNERIFEERRGLPWELVLGASEQAYAALAEHVRSLDDQALTDPARFAWLKGRALVSNVLANGYWHPLEHAARFYIGRGDADRAADLLDRSIVQDKALELLPNERGAALYNLACFYATTGQPAKALAALPEALRLSPELVEWSKQDGDLDALRGDPAFQALYTS